MIAAFGYELARRVELFVRLLQEPRGLGPVGQSGRRRARLGERVQRREGFALRQSEPRAFEREVAEIEPHRPRLGDLLHVVEVAPRAVPFAEGAAESGAGEQAASDKVAMPRSAQALEGLVEPDGGGARMIARSLCRRCGRQAVHRLAEMGAADGQSIERDVDNPVYPPHKI